KAILERNIELYDHELITNAKGRRLVAFGRYAGIVGTYNAFRTYGLKFGLYQMPKAEQLKDRDALIGELKKLELPNIRILLTGRGRVGQGALEMLEAMGLKKVGVQDFLNVSHPVAVYCQIDASDYNKRKDGQRGNKADFFNKPGEYESNFF